jgi:hypothetical protein
VEISNREAVNRFYDLAQRAQRVKETLAVVRGTIQALDEALDAEAQTGNSAALVATQSKLEWIEIIVISVYVAELAKLLAEMFRFREEFAGWSVLGWSVLTLGGACWMLQPWKHQPRRRLGALIGLLGLFLAWFLVGDLWLRQDRAAKPPQEAAPAAKSARAAIRARQALEWICPAECLGSRPAAAAKFKEAEGAYQKGQYAAAEAAWRETLRLAGH